MEIDNIYINDNTKHIIITVNNIITTIYDDYYENYDEIKNTIIIIPTMYIIIEEECEILTHRTVTILEENTSDIFFSCFEDSKNINQVEAIVNDNSNIASSTYVFDSLTDDSMQYDNNNNDNNNNEESNTYGIYAFSIFMFGIGSLCVNKVMKNI